MRRGRAAKLDEPTVTKEDPTTGELTSKAKSKAIVRLEQTIHHVVEAEVDALFHALRPDEKEAIKQKAKTSVTKGASKAKQKVEHADPSKVKALPSYTEMGQYYPYDWPIEDQDRQFQRLLYAIESAENAVFHAVEEEVATLFHGLQNAEGHSDIIITKHAKKALKTGASKASKHVEKEQKERRSWFLNQRGADKSKEVGQTEPLVKSYHGMVLYYPYDWPIVPYIP